MKQRKRIIGLLLSATIVSCMAISASATVSKDYWDIYYIYGAPSSISNQYDYASLDYNSGGYYAKATSWSSNNSNGSYVKITSDCSLTMPSRSLTKKGSCSPWTMGGVYSGGKIRFKLTAKNSTFCDANGYIEYD